MSLQAFLPYFRSPAAAMCQCKHLESQVAQNDGPVYPNMAHNSLKVAQNCGRRAFQSALQALSIAKIPPYWP